MFDNSRHSEAAAAAAEAAAAAGLVTDTAVKGQSHGGALMS